MNKHSQNNPNGSSSSSGSGSFFLTSFFGAAFLSSFLSPPFLSSFLSAGAVVAAAPVEATPPHEANFGNPSATIYSGVFPLVAAKMLSTTVLLAFDPAAAKMSSIPF